MFPKYFKKVPIHIGIFSLGHFKFLRSFDNENRSWNLQTEAVSLHQLSVTLFPDVPAHSHHGPLQESWQKSCHCDLFVPASVYPRLCSCLSWMDCILPLSAKSVAIQRHSFAWPRVCISYSLKVQATILRHLKQWPFVWRFELKTYLHPWRAFSLKEAVWGLTPEETRRFRASHCNFVRSNPTVLLPAGCHAISHPDVEGL